MFGKIRINGAWLYEEIKEGVVQAFHNLLSVLEECIKSLILAGNDAGKIAGIFPWW